MANPKKTKKAVIQERRAKVAALVLSGMTYREIKQEIGCSMGTISSDMKAMMEQWSNEQVQNLDDWREIELKRLDAALKAIWPQVEAGDLKANAAFVRLSERRSKLKGLDAPSKIAGHDGGPIKLEGRLELALERAYGEEGDD
jgi:hypothetical protein